MTDRSRPPADRSGTRIVRPALTHRPAEFRRFELEAQLDLGGEAEVYWVRYHEDEWKRVQQKNDAGENEDATFTVVDRYERFACPAVLEEQTPPRGIARFWGDAQAWEIVALEMPARWIQFTVQNLSADAHASAITAYWDGLDPARFWESVLLYNTCSMFAASAPRCGVATWDERHGQYRIVQMSCF